MLYQAVLGRPMPDCAVLGWVASGWAVPVQAVLGRVLARVDYSKTKGSRGVGHAGVGHHAGCAREAGACWCQEDSVHRTCR